MAEAASCAVPAVMGVTELGHFNGLVGLVPCGSLGSSPSPSQMDVASDRSTASLLQQLGPSAPDASLLSAAWATVRGIAASSMASGPATNIGELPPTSTSAEASAMTTAAAAAGVPATPGLHFLTPATGSASWPWDTSPTGVCEANLEFLAGSVPAVGASCATDDSSCAQSVGPAAMASSIDKVPEFASRWGLNAGAVQWLYSLEEDICATVIREFAPRCEGRDVVRMLYGFGRSIAARKATWQQHQAAVAATPGLVQMSVPAPAVAGDNAMLQQPLSALDPTAFSCSAASTDGVTLAATAPGTSNVGTPAHTSCSGTEQPAHLMDASMDRQNMGELGRSGDSVADFAQYWDLDWSAVQWLLSVEESVRSTIIAEFSPRCEKRDVHKMLYAFGQSVASRHAANATMSEEMRAFTQRWGLDGCTVGWLLSLAPAVQGVLIREFAPREGTGDSAAKLRAFARSVEARVALAAQHQAPAVVGTVVAHGGPRPAGPPTNVAYPRDPRYEEFVKYWGLEENSRSLLLSLSVDVQTTVIDQFNPRGEAVNVNGKFIAFARSVAAGKDAQVALESFAVHWRLDVETKEYIRSLPPELRSAVIARFDPAPATRDMNSKLRAFTRSLEKIMGYGGYTNEQPWAPHGNPHPAVQWQGHQVAVAGRPPGMPLSSPGIASVASSAPVGVGEIPADEAEFITRWNFGPETGARELLQSLPPEVKARVINEFAPAPCTRDVFKLFAGFASSVARAMGAPVVGAGIGPRPWNQPTGATPLQELGVLDGMLPMTVVASHEVSAGVAGNSSCHPNVAPCLTEEEFINRWQLDEGSKALLRGLPDHVRAVVMAEFHPRPPIYDIGGKFCAFARSVAARQTGDPRGMKRAAEWSESVHG